VSSQRNLARYERLEEKCRSKKANKGEKENNLRENTGTEEGEI